jgi:PAS domain S-box-containing protein
VPLTRTAARWGAAFLTLVLATAVNFWLQPLLGGRAPFLVLVPAVILVAYIAGAAPAFVVLALALLTTTFLWIEPLGQLAVTSASDVALITLGLFSGSIGIAFSLMARKLLFESRRREAEIAAMLEVVPAAVWISRDPECRVVTGSDMTYQMLGVDRGENLSSTDPKPWRPRVRLLNADGHELTTEELPLRVAISTGKAQRGLRMEIVFDTGERRFLFGSAEPLMAANNTPAGAVAAFVDVSDLMEKERALRSSEERYHTLADAVPSFVWATDAKGTPEYINRRFAEYTGLTLEQLREQGWESITHPDDRERLGVAWETAVARGELTENEFRWRCHDGTYRWFWGRAVPLKDADGRLTRWVDTALDITERRRAEAEARRLASVIESTPDVVAMTRPDGQFVYVNAAARKIAGIPPESDITTYRQPAFCPAWVYERTRREWLPEALQRGAVSAEGAILTLDGREIPVSFVLLVHRGERGEVELISTIARDISVQKRAEQQLQEESRRKDQFLATLAG